MKITVIKAVVLSIGLTGFTLPALADGIEIPKTVRPSMGGNYVLRAGLLTNTNVQELEFAPFKVLDSGSIGEEVSGYEKRPNTINTRAGVMSSVLVTIPSSSATHDNKLAMCMWKKPVIEPSASSRVINAFRYCKIFTLEQPKVFTLPSQPNRTELDT
jgi:hypothetical protein